MSCLLQIDNIEISYLSLVNVRGSLPSAICQLPASARHSWSPNKRVLRERTPYLSSTDISAAPDR
eukprot:scaffold48164_cov68-Phaeocystis_antarctica.AAC.5